MEKLYLAVHTSPMRNSLRLALLSLFLSVHFPGSAAPPVRNRERRMPEMDTSRLLIANRTVISHYYLKPKSNVQEKDQLLAESYWGGSRAGFAGKYDAFFGGFQYQKEGWGFGEIGFSSYREGRMSYSTLHLPEKLSVAFAFNGRYNVYGLHFTAQQPLIRKTKSIYVYDLLSIGAQIRLYNNGAFTSRNIMPIVSISPPGKIINNFELTYGYNYFVNGSEITHTNTRHVFSIHYIFPNF